MEEYIIVDGGTIKSNLEMFVKEKIKKGYVCRGSPLIVNGEWHQAMVLAK